MGTVYHVDAETLIETPIYRIDMPRRCRVKTRTGNRCCQGVYGHEGLHWCYDERGWLERWPSRSAIRCRFDMARMHIPPGSKNYIHPLEMQKQHWAAFGSMTPMKRKRKVKMSKRQLSVLQRRTKRHLAS